MQPTLKIGWTTCDNHEVAERMARQLVEQKLAACVQIEPEVRSFYLWDGNLQDEPECRLMLKFRSDRQADLEAFLQSNHPYETHEWVVVNPDRVCEKYLQWALK